MDALIYLAVIACLGLVVAWYLTNETEGAGGAKGLLAIAFSSPPETGPAYRKKVRGRPLKAALGKAEESAAAYRRTRTKNAFRNKDERGYRVKPPRGATPEDRD